MTAVQVAATRTYQEVIAEYALTSSDVLKGLWDSLGSWDEADVDRFIRQAQPLIEGVAVASAQASAAYYTVLTGEAATVDTAPIVAAIPDKLRTPFTAYWHGLTVRPWEEALQAGSSSAEAVGANVAHQSARDGMALLQPTGSRYARRLATQGLTAGKKQWFRVLTGKSCEWCQFFSTLRYYTAESATFGHDHCDCSVVVVTDPSSNFAADMNDKIRSAAGYDERKIAAEVKAWQKAQRARR